MNDSYSSAPPEVDDRCLALRAIVHEVADGDGLRIDEARSATAHLAACAPCRALVGTQRAYRAACARAGAAERAPATLSARVVAAIDEESLSTLR